MHLSPVCRETCERECGRAFWGQNRARVEGLTYLPKPRRPENADHPLTLASVPLCEGFPGGLYLTLLRGPFAGAACSSTSDRYLTNSGRQSEKVRIHRCVESI